MKNTLYITNKTDQPMIARICSDYTGGSIMTYELKPGPNEIAVKSLDKGVYFIQLEDANHDIFYKQKIIKD